MPDVKRIEIEHDPNTPFPLGRHVEHDPRSRAFAFVPSIGGVDPSTWRTKTIPIYDPRPNPNQPVGCCTMCAKAMQLNAKGNRKKGVILGMDWALDGYVWETHNDQFPGAWNRDGSGQDTGSSGLAACKTAQHFGVGGEYNFLFGGADQVVQAVMDGHVVNVGTRWDYSMFKPDDKGIVHPGGSAAGGHEWTVRGYNKRRDLIMGRCWWGPGFRDFWISRFDLQALLADNGDAHVQARV